VKISPRGVFASGKSASSSGLTAAAVKDDLGDGRWTLEAGALVMADMGLAAVDEMDKMSREDKSALHEAMEQQTISVAKAGILATLKSRCALLGAANPKYGRFDKYEGLAEQINMPPALISRFDLLFILLDVPDRTKDSNIANHILKSQYAGELLEQRNRLPSSTVTKEDIESHIEVILPTIENDLMRKYVAYARRKVFPIMEDDAREHLINFYLDLRKQGEGKDSPVPVTARQLEALVRIAEASARIRLSNVVTMDDAKRTTRITMACMRQVGVDPDTGAFDVDVIASGTSKSQRDKIHLIKDIITRVSERHAGSKAPLEEVYAEAESEDIDRERAEELVTKMKRQGDLLAPDNKHIKLV
jgi:replicative DNA helicase Mcm